MTKGTNSTNKETYDTKLKRDQSDIQMVLLNETDTTSDGQQNSDHQTGHYNIPGTSYNSTEPESYAPNTFERGFTTSAHVGIFLCSVGIVFNVLLMTLLGSSKRNRNHYLYRQILSISIADLGFITMVDCFTVYYELHPWQLGAQFCKAWMILDVALPSVALLALMLLNIDRVVFTYKNVFYKQMMSQTALHVILLLAPWCVSSVVVCSLWLGFPAVEPVPNMCVYGITAEAHSASSWLTVFLPSLCILVLLIFVFIAVIGEMPAVSQVGSIQLLPTSPAAENGAAHEEVSFDSNSRGRSAGVLEAANSVVSGSTDRNQRRFITALLAEDFVSLAITLPFSAFSIVSPKCIDSQSCDSLMTLFQTLSWMRSSVTCLRPLLFLLLTDIYHRFKESFVGWYLGEQDNTAECSTTITQSNPIEYLILTRFTARHNLSRNNSTSTTCMTPPQSPFAVDSSGKSKNFSPLVKPSSDGTFL